MERALASPNLSTRIYQVDFSGGKVTELNANLIAESMYAQCDEGGNDYLLLDVLVDYYNDNKAISLKDQHTSKGDGPVPCMTTAGLLEHPWYLRSQYLTLLG